MHSLKVSRAALSIAAALLGIAGAVLVWVAVSGRQDSPPTPPGGQHVAGGVSTSRAAGPVPASPTPSSRSSAGPTKGGVPDRIAGTVLPASRPRSVQIPRLRISSPLIDLGLVDGAMAVPTDPAVAGWYKLGPTPGELGPAVIAGHVTWNQVPAVFFRLGELHRGDRIRVTRRDGRVAVFSVIDVRRFPKVRFPTRVVFGTIDYAGLRLITCGGTYDSSAHRYLDNIVVFARLTSVHRAAG
jgi:Sortase domain